MSVIEIKRIGVIGLFAVTAFLAASSGTTSDRALLSNVQAAQTSAGVLERSQDDPTAWWWYHGVSPDRVSQLITTNQARLVAIKVEQSSPSLLLAVAMVANQGPYNKAWWWYYGQTAGELGNLLSTNNARLIDLEPYDAGGQVRFAAVMVSNTGSDAKAWWWYHGISTAQISELVQQNSARLVDLDTYLVGGERQYSVVMVSNTGADARAWWWYFNVTSDQISGFTQANNARLIDIERHDSSTGTFSVVMEACPCPSWWVYYNITESRIGELAAQNGARIVDVEPYQVGSSKLFAVIMINNSGDITERVGEALRSRTDGTVGLYLKEVNGPVLAALQERFVFEPASTIKVIVHLHAMREIQAGRARFDDAVNVLSINGCDPPVDTGDEQLSAAIKEMMRVSDNLRTAALRLKFTDAAINTTASNAEMTNTRLDPRHVLGFCGGENPNQATLADLGHLYENVANGTLLSGTARENFYYLMAGREMYLEVGHDFTGVWPKISAVVDQAASDLGKQAMAQSFKDQIRWNHKAGGLGLSSGPNTGQNLSIGGWVRLPSCTGTAFAERRYVYGDFVSRASDGDRAFDALMSGVRELLRDPIYDALRTWGTCTASPLPAPAPPVAPTRAPSPVPPSGPTPVPPPRPAPEPPPTSTVIPPTPPQPPAPPPAPVQPSLDRPPCTASNLVLGRAGDPGAIGFAFEQQRQECTLRDSPRPPIILPVAPEVVTAPERAVLIIKQRTRSTADECTVDDDTHVLDLDVQLSPEELADLAAALPDLALEVCALGESP